MFLGIHLDTGNLVTLELLNFCVTAEDLKNELSLQTGRDLSQYALFLGSFSLEDTAELTDFDLSEHDVLTLQPSSVQFQGDPISQFTSDIIQYDPIEDSQTLLDNACVGRAQNAADSRCRRSSMQKRKENRQRRTGTPSKRNPYGNETPIKGKWAGRNKTIACIRPKFILRSTYASKACAVSADSEECITCDSDSDAKSDRDLARELAPSLSSASVLERYVHGVEYFISVRALQTDARHSKCSSQELVARILSLTTTSSRQWLNGIVLTSRKSAYRCRRWAPLRPSLTTSLDAARKPGLSHGVILKHLIIVRLFAGTSRRLTCWETPLSWTAYYDKAQNIYRSFGHGSYKRYCERFRMALDTFRSESSLQFLDSLLCTEVRPLSMQHVNELLGRRAGATAWSSHIVLNDFASLVGADVVKFDKTYHRASSSGKGIPISDVDVENVRTRVNQNQQCVLRLGGLLAKHEIKHVLCETRQWKIWKIAHGQRVKEAAGSLQDLAQEMAAYMLREIP